MNADILRLMGVVSGAGGNTFRPNDKLTRAQFCTMAVNFMGLGDQVVLHSTRTIFTDVPSSHWAICRAMRMLRSVTSAAWYSLARS